MEKITVTVTFGDDIYQQKYPAGTVLKEFAFRFLEDNMLDDGCFIHINGKNMTHNIDYVLQDGDEITVHPMILGGG